MMMVACIKGPGTTTEWKVMADYFTLMAELPIKATGPKITLTDMVSYTTKTHRMWLVTTAEASIMLKISGKRMKVFLMFTQDNLKMISDGETAN